MEKFTLSKIRESLMSVDKKTLIDNLNHNTLVDLYIKIHKKSLSIEEEEMKKNFSVSYKINNKLFFRGEFTSREDAVLWCKNHEKYDDMHIIYPNGRKEKYQR